MFHKDTKIMILINVIFSNYGNAILGIVIISIISFRFIPRAFGKHKKNWQLKF